MSKISITKEFSFEAAHALEGYDGPCRNIHGHSYKLHVTVSGTPVSDPSSPKCGMVMDFSDLKKIIKEQIVDPLDHALILSDDSIFLSEDRVGASFSKVMIVRFRPTSENLLIDFAGRIIPLLPQGVSLDCLRLRETANSYAEWHAGDQSF